MTKLFCSVCIFLMIDGRHVQTYSLEESHYDLWHGNTKIASNNLLRNHTAALAAHI